MRINSKDILIDAQEKGYAIPAFNIHNLETFEVVASTANELKSPVIIAGTPGTYKFAGRDYIQAIYETSIKRYKVPIVLHLDHHQEIDGILESLVLGIKSIMIDGSHLSFEENILLTKKVVDLAHIFGATVEAELGMLSGQEDDLIVSQEDSIYTDPNLAQEFVERTGIDSLAVAIGTAHGSYKEEPKLDIERLSKIKEKVSIPLVLHGASGISDKVVHECIKRGICKVNVATELKDAFTTELRNYLITNKNDNDPRNYFGSAKEAMKKIVIDKIKMCGSDNKATL